MFEIQGGVSIILSLVLFVVKGFALVDCVVRPAAQFTYLETLSKNAWLIILVLSLLGHAVLSGWSPLGLWSLLGTVAAFVYLAQVRGSQR